MSTILKRQVIRITKGDCEPLIFIRKNPDGTPIDNSGEQAIFEVTWEGGSLELSTTDGELVNGGANGRTAGEITQAMSQQFPEGAQTEWKFRIIDTTGCRRTKATGVILAEP